MIVAKYYHKEVLESIRIVPQLFSVFKNRKSRKELIFMNLNKEKQDLPEGRSHKEEHNNILSALRKEFDYDTRFSGEEQYRRICKRLDEIENPPTDEPRRPCSPELKEQLLRQKVIYENTPYLMNRPSSFAEQVRMDVEYIVNHKLNKNVPNLPQKITSLMRRWGLDLQWLKDKMGISSSRIHDFLNTEKPVTTISSFYLEAFCLIFFSDVYEFIGLRDRIKVDDPTFLCIPVHTPLIPTDGPEYGYYNFVMNRLGDPHNEDSLLRLRITTKIAKLKPTKYQVFQYIVSQIPTLNDALHTPLLDVSEMAINEQTREYISKATIKYLFCDTPDETQRYYIIAEAGQFLRYLTRFDLERMKTLAHFANAGDTVWRILAAILIDGNFPAKSTSLHSKFDNFIA